MPLPGCFSNAVEPMQVDVQPEDNENNEEDMYIVENPSIDLEQLANQYTGLAKLHRLIYVADHCPTLRLEALRMAINYVTTTYNVTLYQHLHKKLADNVSTLFLPDVASQSTGSQEIPSFDATWVESKSKKSALKLEKLDCDLKNYKANSIKESIRRGHDDLGDHYLNCGDLSNALKCYSRARDYCTSGKHVVNMCLNVIKVSIYLQNWSHVLSYVSKAEGTAEIAETSKDKDPNQVVITRLKCAAGLAELATRKYKSAAKHFLQANFDHCEFPEMISTNNVAMYGGLCALATFDRQELKQVIASSSFKLFLELEPQLRDIIFKFYESKYDSCLKLLDEIKDNLLLDMYIAPHVNALYTQIRNRALVQYFSPYMSADMRKMATAFNRSVAALENELMQLILEGQIQARIDSHNKILYAKDADHRSATFEKAINVGKEFQRRTRMFILRAAILRRHIHVKNQPRESSNHGTEICVPASGSSSGTLARN
ncbi:COP9 signalosome complex subunit 1b [Anopheles arabiensis]|uniref:AGAP004953-PA n=4 Tax=gambiae species complex TaxID=44542 RepID=Q7Q7Y5_ANOGA|nr:COP9 signalosome complex subunit 1b [Anopheles arabiensis]XP_040222981.1 COP9 signalosome complex subunit 1b [Anopheles coluzzii]XP_041771472.1 COP9 signalosome complex subunit 1b [Anopheles merus]XP_315051.4 COP9 signalosome complex subunit 1b [Anopheles gambiae]EAA10359.4 AGAP004953-PA [Anopheles gambiae str. PEST]